MKTTQRQSVFLVVLFSLSWAQSGCMPQPNRDSDGEETVTSPREEPGGNHAATGTKRISVGVAQTLWIKEDGTLWASGLNSTGQLGDGSTSSRDSFRMITRSSDWVEVSAGMYHSVGLQEDGSLWTWGGNHLGQLGDRTLADRYVPQRVLPVPGFTCSDIASGYDHGVAVRSDGTLWSWGLEHYSEESLLSPAIIGKDSDWATVSAGNYHSIALKRDGTLWAWGLNLCGQLGNGSTLGQELPVEISPGTRWSHVSAGKLSTIGVRSDGTLWLCGNVFYNFELSLVQVGNDNDWHRVAAGNDSFAAIKTDGSLWAWGMNDLGLPGLEMQPTYTDTPVRVSHDRKVTDLACGEYNLVILEEGDAFQGWGDNSYGQIGK